MVFRASCEFSLYLHSPSNLGSVRYDTTFFSSKCCKVAIYCDAKYLTIGTENNFGFVGWSTVRVPFEALIT